MQAIVFQAQIKGNPIENGSLLIEVCVFCKEFDDEPERQCQRDRQRCQSNDSALFQLVFPPIFALEYLSDNQNRGENDERDRDDEE